MGGNNSLKKESILSDIITNKALIGKLAKNDFKTKFAASYLGAMWAFVQPVITLLVYWFVFSVGLRADRGCDYPFVLWLMAGLVPWFFFSDALNGGTGAMVEYNYLVKKVVFKISILPMVKVVAAIFVHLFFVFLILVLGSCYGYYPSLYSLQIIYYILCTFVLVLGLVYLTSAVAVLFRDLVQLINILLQVGIWLTPIMWDAGKMLAEHKKLLFVMKLNPVYYVVEGFRDAIFSTGWFFEKPLWTAYFWVLAIVVFILGTGTFKKLKCHFADVL